MALLRATIATIPRRSWRALLGGIAGTDYATFTLDGKTYDVSYGFNSFAKTFPCFDEVPEHVLNISEDQLPYFQSLCVEPMFLCEGIVDTALNATDIITFNAGGPISILTRPEFAYNWLYIQLDDAVIKRVYDTASYPKIDPAFYAVFVEGGSYIRDDISVTPGAHELKVQGNGSLAIKVVVNYDFDKDDLSNPEEVQQEGLSNLDPLVPNAWGFSEKSSDAAVMPEATDGNELEGQFSFLAPRRECGSCGSGAMAPNYLYVDVFNGQFSQFALDGDSFLLEGVTLSAEVPYTNPSSQFVAEVQPGWHQVEYAYASNDILSNLSFRLNSQAIEVLDISELQDSDGDGVIEKSGM